VRASRVTKVALFVVALFGPAVTAPPLAHGTGSADEVVVDKSDRELYVLRQGRIIARIPIALGFAPRGHKQQRGDGRTPEGRYVLDWRNPNSKFYRSIHISYPGPADLARAERDGIEPGGDIFIHGTPAGPEFVSLDWTAGCIAVSNTAMDLIWNRVPDGTPITIRP